MFWLLSFILFMGAMFISLNGEDSNPDSWVRSDQDKAHMGCLSQLIGSFLYYGSAYLLHYFFDVLSSLTFGWFTFILIMGHFLILLFRGSTEYKNAKKR